MSGTTGSRASPGGSDLAGLAALAGLSVLAAGTTGAGSAIWARVTQGEHLLAPRIIENQLSAGDPTWHRRRDSMWHCYNASPAKPHYAALRQILNILADNLAGQIDER